MDKKVTIRIEVIPEEKTLPISVRTYPNSKEGVETAMHYLRHCQYGINTNTGDCGHPADSIWYNPKIAQNMCASCGCVMAEAL